MLFIVTWCWERTEQEPQGRGGGTSCLHMWPPPQTLQSDSSDRHNILTPTVNALDTQSGKYQTLHQSPKCSVSALGKALMSLQWRGRLGGRTQRQGEGRGCNGWFWFKACTDACWRVHLGSDHCESKCPRTLQNSPKHQFQALLSQDPTETISPCTFQSIWLLSGRISRPTELWFFCKGISAPCFLPHISPPFSLRVLCDAVLALVNFHDGKGQQPERSLSGAPVFLWTEDLSLGICCYLFPRNPLHNNSSQQNSPDNVEEKAGYLHNIPSPLRCIMGCLCWDGSSIHSLIHSLCLKHWSA